MPSPKTLLIPALLDVHWPLLRWVFATPEWEPVILEHNRAQVEDAGLRNTHNDLCYPFVLITGQVLRALRSGAYDLARTGVLISQTGDGCRGSCLIRLLRPVLDREGFAQVPLLSLNTRGLEPASAFPITPGMAPRALAAAFWGDALLLLGNQVRPLEKRPGETDALVRDWQARLSRSLEAGRGLSLHAVLRRCREMAQDFRSLETDGERPIQEVALVGDIYSKYCSLGNWNLTEYLERRGCRVWVNGLTWYALYYLDSHLELGPAPMRLGGKTLAALGGPMQRRFIRVLREAGFTVLPPYPALKALERAKLGGSRCALGSGWLLAAEAAGWVETGCRKVLSALPFQCLPGHIYGRGRYAALQRQLPGSLIVGVDYDAGLRDVTVESRVRMLVDTEL
ncbi:MAG: hypothetical protein HFG09_06000 [Oscillibacter sp.]|nr:hypothetical protein [Oscillibacter sp.]